MTDQSPTNARPGVRAPRLTRRQVAGGLGAGAALAGIPALRLISHDKGAPPAAAQGTVATGSPDAGSYYRPTAVVGSPEAQPTGEVATPVGPDPGQATQPATADLDQFMALSTALVGGGRLDQARGSQLLALIAADPDRQRALQQLLALTAAAGATTPITTAAGLPPEARNLTADILRFWYLGTFDGQPVEDRATFWFSLSSWQAVRYTFAPSICKAFGGWAQPPPVQT